MRDRSRHSKDICEYIKDTKEKYTKFPRFALQICMSKLETKKLNVTDKYVQSSSYDQLCFFRCFCFCFHSTKVVLVKPFLYLEVNLFTECITKITSKQNRRKQDPYEDFFYFYNISTVFFLYFSINIVEGEKKYIMWLVMKLKQI